MPHLSLIGMENVRVRPGGNGFSVWVEGRLRRRGPARQVSVFFDVGDAASPTWQQYLIFVVADEFGNTTKPRQMDRQELTELWTVLQPIVENYKQMPAYRFSDTMKEDAQAAERLLGWIGESLKRTAP
ncbi:MAG: hypothetical protein HY554_07880 [Elusimicrobia bacterium]|nr:hypothetical protein [Elusimicrobiota bacterium]